MSPAATTFVLFLTSPVAKFQMVAIFRRADDVIEENECWNKLVSDWQRNNLIQIITFNAYSAVTKYSSISHVNLHAYVFIFNRAAVFPDLSQEKGH